MNKPNYIAKIVLVDDEDIFLDDITEQIENADLPVKVVGTANSVNEALKVISSTLPDFVISDVRMPGNDGLFLAQKLKEQFPYIKCVLISGYMDFSYAKKALAIGIMDYLIKPINIEDLKVCLTNLYDNLTGPSHRLQKSLLASEINSIHQADWATMFSNSSFFMYLVCIGNLFDSSQYKWISLDYYNLLTRIDFNEIISTRLSKYRIWIISREEPNSFFIFVDPTESKYNSEELANEIRLVLEENVEYLPATVVYLPEPVPYDSIYTKACLQRACIASNSKAWQGGILNANDSISPRINSAVLSHEEIQGIELVYSLGSFGTLTEKLRDIFSNRVKKYPHLQDLQLFMNSLTEYLLFRSKQMPRVIDSEDFEWINSKIVLSDSFDSCFTSFCDSLLYLMNPIQNSQLSPETLIMQSCAYIDQHYDEQISIEFLSRKYYLTLEHYIRTFKKYTGITPLQYLINKRIASAEFLLLISPPINIKQIANMVGYNNSHYFSRIFKSQTGESPTEYRINHLDKEKGV